MSKCRFKVSKSVEHLRNYNPAKHGFLLKLLYRTIHSFQSYFYVNFVTVSFALPLYMSRSVPGTEDLYPSSSSL